MQTPVEPAQTLNLIQSFQKDSTLVEEMKTLENDLLELDKALLEYVSSDTKTLNHVTSYVLKQKGKRLRPSLYFLACNLVDYHGKHRTKMAVVSEYIHTASLLHDDVIDNSTLRRNKPTSHSIWGDETAILVGDYIYSTASILMTETGRMEIVTTFAKVIQKMSEGELLQLDHIFDMNISEDAYFKIIEGKTSCLMAALCKAAGILGEVDDNKVKALESFGYNLGTAFQLVDDILDYQSNSKIFGKNTLNDLKEGKITLPIILLKRHFSESKWQELTQKVEGGEIYQDFVLEMKGFVDFYKTVEQSIQYARTYAQKAADLLDQVFEDSKPKQSLLQLANSLHLRLF